MKRLESLIKNEKVAGHDGLRAELPKYNKVVGCVHQLTYGILTEESIPTD